MANDLAVERPAPRTAPIERATLCADGTRLALPGGRVVELATAPDAAGSRRVHRVLRRVEHVDLEVHGAGVAASVTGVGHRRQCRIPVSLATALALVLEGAPATVVVSTTDTPEGSS